MAERGERVRALVERRGAVANRDVARALGVSPATAHRLLQALVLSGVLERRGKGRAARYLLRGLRRRFALKGLSEERVWTIFAAHVARVRPHASPDLASLQYAATEVINNAIDHSRGRWVDVSLEFGGGETRLVVTDDGVGVFRRLCQDFGFATPQDAIVQLEKGKLTTDPSRHSGEGLFFSSKAVARFRLESQRLAWIVDNLAHDSALAESPTDRGTRVVLEVIPGKTPRLEDVFAAYTDPETLRFAKTRVTVRLVALGRTLISRSEARRVAEGLTKFEHATLDFSGVDVVGQGFCDELFRVFARAHPKLVLEPVGMNDPIAFMVARARAHSIS
jgi:anti-sigma regulatory factor (Ser/Thr protein kinase)